MFYLSKKSKDYLPKLIYLLLKSFKIGSEQPICTVQFIQNIRSIKCLVFFLYTEDIGSGPKHFRVVQAEANKHNMAETGLGPGTTK